MTIVITEIQWDIDDDIDPSEEGLPESVIIDNPTQEMLEDINGYANNIADYLSDTYGYCVFNFTITQV